MSKVVWITGASEGIGAALVNEFAKAGFSIVLSARREAQLKIVAEKANLAENRFLILPLDLSQLTDIEIFINKIKNKFGRIDRLILNAGISQKGRAEATLASVEREIMEINYFANVQLAKAVLPTMQAQGGGQIAVVSSIVGKFGSPFLSTYAASKHALIGFFESLRYEVASQNVDILIVTPGFIKTNIAKKAVTEDGSLFNEDSKAQANGTAPEKVARAIYSAINRRKKHIYVGGLETWTPHFKFIFPNLFYWIWKKLHKL
jgi:short-subunit dehydrogenase